MPLPLIDKDVCKLCKTCVEVCARAVLVANDKEITTRDDDCMLCAQCYAACKHGAISFDTGLLRQPEFRSFTYKEETPGKTRLEAGDLVNLFRSRRSVRKYKEQPVPDEVVRDLVEFGTTAPSGSNVQGSEFVVANGRDKVMAVADGIRLFFEKINRIARNPITRYATVPIMGKTLIEYHRDRLDRVEWAIEEFKSSGRDFLFWGAPCIVVVHSPHTGSTPKEDALLVSYNIVLLAHALGLGSCFIGYATSAINRAKEVKRILGMPDENEVHAVLTLGYPDVEYKRLALRKPYRLVRT